MNMKDINKTMQDEYVRRFSQFLKDYSELSKSDFCAKEGLDEGIFNVWIRDRNMLTTSLVKVKCSDTGCKYNLGRQCNAPEINIVRKDGLIRPICTTSEER